MRKTVLSKVKSISQHIYDIFVGKSKPHPVPPGYRYSILLSTTQSLGPCRHLQLAWFLCALEERLPSTGLLLADVKQASLAKIFASLYQVAGDLERHHSQSSITSQGKPGVSHVSCEPLGDRLSRAMHRVQSGIEFPDSLLENVIASGDSRPLTPLVISSPLLKDAITRYDTLYREHIDQLHSSAVGTKPSNNGWISRWCTEWLAEVQGITKFNWDSCTPGMNTKNLVFESGAPTIWPAVAHTISKNSQPLSTTSSASTTNSAAPRAKASIVHQPVPQLATAPKTSPAARPAASGTQESIVLSQSPPQPASSTAFEFYAPMSRATRASMSQSQPAPHPASEKNPVYSRGKGYYVREECTMPYPSLQASRSSEEKF